MGFWHLARLGLLASSVMSVQDDGALLLGCMWVLGAAWIVIIKVASAWIFQTPGIHEFGRLPGRPATLASIGHV